jgi:hypothetical protein
MQRLEEYKRLEQQGKLSPRQVLAFHKQDIAEQKANISAMLEVRDKISEINKRDQDASKTAQDVADLKIATRNNIFYDAMKLYDSGNPDAAQLQLETAAALGAFGPNTRAPDITDPKVRAVIQQNASSSKQFGVERTAKLDENKRTDEIIKDLRSGIPPTIDVVVTKDKDGNAKFDYIVKDTGRRATSADIAAGLRLTNPSIITANINNAAALTLERLKESNRVAQFTREQTGLTPIQTDETGGKFVKDPNPKAGAREEAQTNLAVVRAAQETFTRMEELYPEIRQRAGISDDDPKAKQKLKLFISEQNNDPKVQEYNSLSLNMANANLRLNSGPQTGQDFVNEFEAISNPALSPEAHAAVVAKQQKRLSLLSRNYTGQLQGKIYLEDDRPPLTKPNTEKPKPKPSNTPQRQSGTVGVTIELIPKEK